MGAKPYDGAASDRQTRRSRRVRWHRRRRWIGFLVFTLVAAGVLGLAYTTVSGGDDPASVTATVLATTTPPVPPAGPFAVTAGVNVRSGPGTTYPSVGTVDAGKPVMVTCVATGETIDGPRGSVNTWVRVTAPGVTGFVTSQYVATGAAISDPHVIPPC
jgi:hypothetical protein